MNEVQLGASCQYSIANKAKSLISTIAFLFSFPLHNRFLETALGELNSLLILNPIPIPTLLFFLQIYISVTLNQNNK